MSVVDTVTDLRVYCLLHDLHNCTICHEPPWLRPSTDDDEDVSEA